MRLHSLFAVLVTAILATVLAVPSHAAWPRDPGLGGLVVCNAASTQTAPLGVADGAGGTIVAWYDSRNSNNDIYAQRISAAGVPLWTANGVAICTNTASQSTPELVSDGQGGAIIAWRESRAANIDVYAQRVNAAGAVQWAANGVPVCASLSTQDGAAMVSDGAGGAILAWRDLRNGVADVYAQRINESGSPMWAVNGIAVCNAADVQYKVSIAADGVGGTILCWSDARNLAGTGYDIYAQRLTSLGASSWTANGVAVVSATGTQEASQLVSDDAGGAMVVWHDDRSGNYDLYAQHLYATGSPAFASNGVLVTSTPESQIFPALARDGSGGAIIAWADYRNDPILPDLYCSRITSAGVVPWTANGVAVSTAAQSQNLAAMVPDGAGGVVLTWDDYRDASVDVFTQRLNASGTPQWGSGGLVVCSAVGNQNVSGLVPMDDGSFILQWTDYRNAGIPDIYAQRVDRYGKLGAPEPAISKVKDIPNDQGGFVKVSWDASYLDADPTYGILEYRVFRSAPGSLATLSARRATTTDSDEAVATGALLLLSNAATATAWEFVGSQAAEALDSYSKVVATTSDSIGGSNPRTLFMVEARAGTASSSQRWYSLPDSGYSVDNLPPAAPAPLTGQYAAGTTTLHWNRNVEGDLAGYRLYRGATVSFVPGPSNFVAQLPDTGAADAAGSPYLYKLTAVDTHGNESPVATLIPSGTLDVSGGAVATLSFAAPQPNPARGSATLRWSLSKSGPVKLALFDASGRRVATVADGVMEAGAHSATLQLRDAAGRALPSGLYLARLEAEGRTITRRIAAIR